MGIQINGQTDTVTAADGSLNLGGNVTIPGVLTYEDVTSVDAVGLSTFQNGIHVTGGSVGIGTDNPTNGTSANARQLVIRNTANPTSRGGLSLIHGTSGTGGFGSIYFGSSNATLRGYIEYAHQTDSMQFGTLAGERLRITSGGNVGINSSSPNSKLDINRGSVTGLSDGTVTDIITISETGSQGNTGQRILFKNTEQNWEQGAITALREGVANSFSLTLSSSNGGSNAEALRITSSGNVGIGTDNPESGSKLTVNGGIFVKNYLTAATIHGGGIDYVNDGRGTRITSYGASGAKTAISFAQGNGGSGASEIARFDTNGNLVFASSGQGIDFSATSDATGKTSELLDDYEEGTFTAQMNFTNLSVSSHSTTLGYYVKVGRIVKCDIFIRFNGSNLSGTPTTGGAVWVSGLPYTGSSTGSTQWVGNPTAVGRLPEYRGTNDSTDFNKIYFYVSNNSSSMYLGVNKDPQSPISTDFLYGLSEKSFSGLIGQGYIFELRAGITYIAS